MYPPMGLKPLLPVDNVPAQTDAPPSYRGRYDPPPFEDIPPGVEPPVPGFEPSPFEKPSFGPPGLMDRERLPPPNFRESFRAPYVEGPTGFRDIPASNVQNEIPVHVGDQPRYRDNYRPYRDQGSIPFREGQSFRDSGGPPGPPYRDPNFRGAGPPFRDNAFRNATYREGGYRDNPPHNFREGGPPFRPPSADPREQPPANYLDPNYRDGYRDESGVNREHMRPGYRPNIRNRGGPRRNPNMEHDRHRERDGRERERYNEGRDPDRARELEKRTREGRDGREPREPREPREVREGRDGREERPREYDRNREYDKDREREHERPTPDRKNRSSPKRSREVRDKKRSESRGRSRERDSRREKKEERTRDKSADKNREHKEKEKKIKERKKKKREKEKEVEKKKKREKKEKKDKDGIKKEEDDVDKDDAKDAAKEPKEDMEEVEKQKPPIEPDENQIDEKPELLQSSSINPEENPNNDLYGDEAAEAVDKEIIQNYVKTDENAESNENKDENDTSKEEPFDGIELQANADELDLKLDIETTSQNKEMLAPLPELSKWEVDDENIEKCKEPGEITSPEEEDDGGKVTSDVIKRAENAIFAKAINSLRPIEIKKISSDRLKLYGDDQTKGPVNNIQITVPVMDIEHRSIEMNEKKKRSSKTPPPRLSVKERLGGKVEDVRRPREPRVVHSTVERVKSRSKTPKKDQPYRRVTVEREKSRKPEAFNRLESSKSDRRIVSENIKSGDKVRSRSPGIEGKKKDYDKSSREDKKYNTDSRNRHQAKEVVAKNNLDRERKKSTLDEAQFEPDYDEHVELEIEAKEDFGKKRERSSSPPGPSESKKARIENETIKLDLTNVKKKAESESESSSDSEYTSSSSSSDMRKRKKKKKRTKKKKKRAASESDSDSDSSSDDHKKKKKKRKHKKKSSKKKKKSKHK